MNMWIWLCWNRAVNMTANNPQKLLCRSGFLPSVFCAIQCHKWLQSCLYDDFSISVSAPQYLGNLFTAKTSTGSSYYSSINGNLGSSLAPNRHQFIGYSSITTAQLVTLYKALFSYKSSSLISIGICGEISYSQNFLRKFLTLISLNLYIISDPRSNIREALRPYHKPFDQWQHSFHLKAVLPLAIKASCSIIWF